jgi:hypothetical protein
MAIRHNLEIRQGEDFARSFVARRSGVVLDITGYEITSQIRNRSDDEDETEHFDTVILNGPAGVFMLSMPSARTAELPAGRTKYDRASRYEYDVRLVSPDGTSFVPVEGYLQVDPSITRGASIAANVFDGGSPSSTPGESVDGGGV